MAADDLRSKLNAKAEAERAKRSTEAGDALPYNLMVLRECPRLADELLARVTRLVGGAQGLTIEKQLMTEHLEPGGVLEAAGFAIWIAGELKATFEPNRANRENPGFYAIGGFTAKVHCIIEMTSSVGRAEILMVSAPDSSGRDSDTWDLAIQSKGQSANGHWKGVVELTDDWLSGVLEGVLLR